MPQARLPFVARHARLPRSACRRSKLISYWPICASPLINGERTSAAQIGGSGAVGAQHSVTFVTRLLLSEWLDEFGMIVAGEGSNGHGHVVGGYTMCGTRDQCIRCRVVAHRDTRSTGSSASRITAAASSRRCCSPSTGPSQQGSHRLPGEGHPSRPSQRLTRRAASTRPASSPSSKTRSAHGPRRAAVVEPPRRGACERSPSCAARPPAATPPHTES
jgi:hypothetical protein